MPLNTTLTFPALAGGTLAQYPVRYEANFVGPANRFSDGTLIVSPQESRLVSRWTLPFHALTNAERDRFEEFLSEAEGAGKPFRFFDPLGNLLRHSNDLANAIWSVDGPLDVAPFVDPDLGSCFVLTNNSSEWRSITQTIGFGAGFSGCLSVETKWDLAVPIRLRIVDADGETQRQFTVSQPRRISIVRQTTATIETTALGISIPGNSQVLVCRPQFEVGRSPLAHLPTNERGGVIENAWLAQRDYQWKSPAPNAHDITLIVESVQI